MEFKMDTPNAFPNGNKEITLRLPLDGSKSHIVLVAKHKGKNAKNWYIDMNRSQALQLAKAIEVIAESLP